MDITAVVPAYNEEEALASVVEEYLEYVDEVVIVDDGSSDATPEIADRLADEHDGVVVVHHETNQGKAHALRTGVDAASGDILVFTDADNTYPAEHIPAMVAELEHGADLVLGNRMAEGKGNIPAFNRIGNRLFSLLVSFVGGTAVQDAQTGMRMLRREDFEALDTEAESLEFETKTTVRATKLGYRIAEVPIVYRERVGEAHLRPLRDGWRMLRSIPAILWGEASPLLRAGIAFSGLFVIAGLYTGLTAVINTIRTGKVQHDFYPLLTALFLIIAFQTFTTLLASEHHKNRITRLEEKLIDAAE